MIIQHERRRRNRRLEAGEQSVVASSPQFHDLDTQVMSKRGKAAVKTLDTIDRHSTMNPMVADDIPHDQVH